MQAGQSKRKFLTRNHVSHKAFSLLGTSFFVVGGHTSGIRRPGARRTERTHTVRQGCSSVRTLFDTIEASPAGIPLAEGNSYTFRKLAEACCVNMLFTRTRCTMLFTRTRCLEPLHYGYATHTHTHTRTHAHTHTHNFRKDPRTTTISQP